MQDAAHAVSNCQLAYLKLGVGFACLASGQDLDVTGYLFPGPRFTGSHFDVTSDQFVATCDRTEA